jgi:hypothetical protein
MAFVKRYAEDSGKRLEIMSEKEDSWWEEEVAFFDTIRSRAWIMVRRIAHTSHHRGQQAAMLRMLGRDLHSTYGPTSDTGGLMAHKAPTIYPYSSAEELIAGEAAGGKKSELPDMSGTVTTERPDAS